MSATMSLTAVYTEDNGPKFHASKQGPDDTRCVLEYLNEGGANFVFRILPEAPEQKLPDSLQGRLLRLRKYFTHVQSAKDQLAAFDEHFKPLFLAEHIIQHDLVELEEGVSASLNAAIKSLDRPDHRLRDVLPLDETHGLLVTDMTPQANDVLLQIKPKWLVQSPNAPLNAKRCRTCALRAQRASKKVRTATDAQEYCPLELISEDEEDRKRAAQGITTDICLQAYLTTHVQPLLQDLQTSQRHLDSHGILGVDNDTSRKESLCKAMTLRDCTLFLKRSGNHVEARLADLDLKQPEKLSRWEQVEQNLVNSGWYTNTEDNRVWQKETVCLLSRNRS